MVWGVISYGWKSKLIFAEPTSNPRGSAAKLPKHSSDPDAGMNKGITSEDYGFQVIEVYVGPQLQGYGDCTGCLQDCSGLYVEDQAPIHGARGALVELKEAWDTIAQATR